MIVSNTTPISNFLHLDQIEILKRLFNKIHIPRAVKQEIEDFFVDDRNWKTCLHDGFIVVHKFSKRYYMPRWHSNLLIEFDMPGKRGKGGPYRLLLDAGADVRHALKGVGLISADIDGVYISHPHSDHIGGAEAKL